MEVTEQFMAIGGTEKAFMSTTADMSVAVSYSLSGGSLLFKINAETFMQCGSDIQWLSAFPQEAEFLYPPQTYLSPTGRTQRVEVQRPEGRVQFVVVELEPQMA